MPSIINATLSNGLVTSADNSGSLQLQTNNGTTAVTIDTSQNVGIGITSITTSGSRRIVQITNGSNGGMVMLSNASTESPNPRIFLEGTNDLGLAAGTTTGAMKFYTNDTERGRFTSGGDFQFNSGYGSVATAYGCRAWVNFNGTGTVAIRSSGNVSSITDLGTGDYRVNFTNNMPDANYVANVTSGVNGVVWGLQQLGPIYSTSQLQFKLFDTSGNATDNSIVNVSIIR